MNTFVFSILWTVCTAALVAAFLRQEGFDANPIWFNVAMFLMPFAGIPFIWDSHRKLRRFRSVRAEGGVFVWTELDGSEQRSDIDPRIAWDREDRNFSDN